MWRRSGRYTRTPVVGGPEKGRAVVQSGDSQRVALFTTHGDTCTQIGLDMGNID